jgi:peptide/nickel transport system permease protein
MEATLPLRILWRLISAVILLIALTFFIALLVEMGKGGGLESLPTAIPAAVDFAVEYLTNLVRGDMGTTSSPYRSVPGKPVSAELARALPNSLGLLAVSMIVAVTIGLYLGMVAARRQHTRVAGLLLFFSTLGMSTPSYFAAMLLIWLGVWLYSVLDARPFPIAGFGWDAHIILPALVLAAMPTAAVTRLSYNALVEILESDHVRTAHSKGLARRLVMSDHVLRNAGVPILTTVIVSLRFSLTVLPIVEYIFSWPGIGLALLTAIQAGDTTTAVGMILVLSMLFVLVNAVVELFYPALDPRLKRAEVRPT